MSDFRNDRFRRTARGADDRRPARPAAPQPLRHKGGQGFRGTRPVWFVAIMDILVLGLAINVFALGNSSLFTPATSGTALPQPSTAVTSTPTPSIKPSAKASAPNTASATPIASPTEQATASPAADQGMWGAKFADKFASGDAVTTDTSYQSKNINITITQDQTNGFQYFVADIYIRNKDNFQAFFVNDHFGGIASTLNQANTRNAILAINGDNAANRANKLGYEVRNGKLYHAVAWQDVLVMYNDGSMKTFDEAGFETEYQSISQNGGSNGGVWQVWTFGPMLLDASGQPMTKFAPDSLTKPGNERTAIGYYEPGHYCLVTVGSTDAENRAGPALADLSQKMYSLGCKAAYNMDGGQSSEMVFNGKFVNTPYHGGRSVSDIVGIGEFGN